MELIVPLNKQNKQNFPLPLYHAASLLPSYAR